jgi:hypothetical protein
VVRACCAQLPSTVILVLSFISLQFICTAHMLLVHFTHKLVQKRPCCSYFVQLEAS